MPRGGWRGNANSLKNLAQPKDKRKPLGMFGKNSHTGVVSQTLGGNYIYYQALKWVDKDDSEKAKAALARAEQYFGKGGVVDTNYSFSSIGNYLTELARRERAKEIATLNESGLGPILSRMGISIEDLTDSSSKDLMKAYNYLLLGGEEVGGKNIFERLVYRTKQRGAHILITDDIYFYIEKAVDELWTQNLMTLGNSIIQKINYAQISTEGKYWKNDVFQFDDFFKHEVVPSIEDYLKNILKLGIEKAFSTARENNMSEEDLKEFEKLIDYLTINEGTGSFLQRMWYTLGFDQVLADVSDIISDATSENFESGKNAKNVKKKFISDTLFETRNIILDEARKNSYVQIDKGFSAENMGQLGVTAFAEGLKKETDKMPNVSVVATGFGVDKEGTFSSGNTGKADFIISIGLPSTLITGQRYSLLGEGFDLLRGTKATSKEKLGDSGITERSENIALYDNIAKMLKDLKGGSIIYTNAKNYALTYKKGQKFGGFSAGTEKRSLGQYVADYQTLGGQRFSSMSARYLITVIGNTMKGALYEGHNKEVTAGLAADIAGFLFDDLMTIGDSIALENEDGTIGYGGAKALHMLYLDGIYVPFSVFLQKLADTFLKTKVSLNAIKGLVRPTIDYTGKTAEGVYYDFGTEGNYHEPEGYAENPMDFWRSQRDMAKNDIKITIHFFRDFREFINETFPEIELRPRD